MGNKIQTLKRMVQRHLNLADGPVTVTSYEFSSPRYQRTASDNPFFRSLIKQNLSATNPMSASTLDTQWLFKPGDFAPGLRSSPSVRGIPPRLVLYYRSPPGADPWAQHSVDSWQTGPPEGYPIAPFFSGSADAKVAKSKAMSQAFTQLRKEQRKLQGLVVLGELRQTLQMLKRPASSLRDYMNRYLGSVEKRTRGVKRKNLRGVLSDTWLEYSFGVQPLLSDVRDAAQLVAHLVQKQHRSTFRAYGEDIGSRSKTETGTLGAEFAHLRRVVTDTEKAFCVVRVGLDCRLDGGFGSTFENLARLSGVDLSNFAPAAWELMPYSFLFDYFGNIGSIIEAASTDVTGVRWVNISEVYESERRVEFILDKKSTQSYFNLHFNPEDFGNVMVENAREVDLLGCYVAKRSTLSRYSGSLAVPDLRLFAPQTFTKFLNLAALTARSSKLERSFQR